MVVLSWSEDLAGIDLRGTLSGMSVQHAVKYPQVVHRVAVILFAFRSKLGSTEIRVVPNGSMGGWLNTRAAQRQTI